MKAHASDARPFLKWAGGKRQLLDALLEQARSAVPFGRYHEPFVGGGALFFELSRRGMLKKHAYLSDNNRNLIDAYLGVRNSVEELIELLSEHKRLHSEDYYYRMRASVPDREVERAARIIYLNKTCFNGLFRENSKGIFNVPFGRYANPLICDEANLRACSIALQRAKVEARPFETVLGHSLAGDFVYFDPPYHPVSKTASFTAYDKGGFGEDKQRELAEVFRKLDKKGVKVLLSNSMTDFVKDLYKGFEVDTVLAKRSVNSRADGRGRVQEALVRNF